MTQPPSPAVLRRDGRPEASAIDLGAELAAISARLRYLYEQLDAHGAAALGLPIDAAPAASDDGPARAGRRFS
jgi:hypothetical protein